MNTWSRMNISDDFGFWPPSDLAGIRIHGHLVTNASAIIIDRPTFQIQCF